MASWRTTGTGILTIVAALASAAAAMLDQDPGTMPDWTAVGAAVTAGLGLVLARDDKVTSERARAR